MLLSRSNRRTIALLTAFLLLLCQVAFAAQLCVQQVSATAEQGLPTCHHAADEGNSTPAPGASGGGCEAPALTAQTVDLPMLAVTAFPALFIAAEVFSPSLDRLHDALAADTQCRPPPLAILHCRLLI